MGCKLAGGIPLAGPQGQTHAPLADVVIFHLRIVGSHEGQGGRVDLFGQAHANVAGDRQAVFLGVRQILVLRPQAQRGAGVVAAQAAQRHGRDIGHALGRQAAIGAGIAQFGRLGGGVDKQGGQRLVVLHELGQVAGQGVLTVQQCQADTLPDHVVVQAAGGAPAIKQRITGVRLGATDSPECLGLLHGTGTITAVPLVHGAAAVQAGVAVGLLVLLVKLLPFALARQASQPAVFQAAGKGEGAVVANKVRQILIRCAVEGLVQVGLADIGVQHVVAQPRLQLPKLLPLLLVDGFQRPIVVQALAVQAGIGLGQHGQQQAGKKSTDEKGAGVATHDSPAAWALQARELSLRLSALLAAACLRTA